MCENFLPEGVRLYLCVVACVHVCVCARLFVRMRECVCVCAHVCLFVFFVHSFRVRLCVHASLVRARSCVGIHVIGLCVCVCVCVRVC